MQGFGLGTMRMIRDATSQRSHRRVSWAPIPSNPVQSRPIPSNPVQSRPIPSNPVQSRPIPSNPDLERLNSRSGNRALTTPAPSALAAWRPAHIHTPCTTLLRDGRFGHRPLRVAGRQPVSREKSGVSGTTGNGPQARRSERKEEQTMALRTVVLTLAAQATERSQLLHRRRWQLGDRHTSTPHAPRSCATVGSATVLSELQGDNQYHAKNPEFPEQRVTGRRPADPKGRRSRLWLFEQLY